MDMTQLKEAASKALAERDAQLEERLKGIDLNLLDLGQKVGGLSEWRGGGGGSSGSGESSPGAVFLKSFDRAAFDRSGRTGKIEVPSFVKAASTITTGQMGTAASPPLAMSYQYVPRLINAFPHVAFAGSAAVFPQIPVGGIDNQAAAQANEGDLKAQSSIVATLQNEPVDTWAHWILCALQVLDDQAGLSSFINSVLLAGLARKVDAALAAQLLALAPPLAVTADNLADACLYARAAIDDQGRTATTAALNTSDYIALLVKKTANGEYLFDGDLAARIGLNLVAGPSIPQGQVLVFDSSIGALLERSMPSVEISREDSDNFRRNLCTLLAECRLLLALYDLNGLVSVSIQSEVPPGSMAAKHHAKQ